MDLVVDSRMKTLNVGIPSLYTAFKINRAKHNSSTE